MYAKISDLRCENMDILELLEDAKLFFEKVEELLNKFQISFRDSEKMFQFQKVLQNTHDKKINL